MNKIISILISAFLAGQTLAATVINVYPTNITTTSAYFQATISTNGGGSTGTVFYGFSDQTTNASSWSMSNDYGNITTTGTVSKQITNLQQAQKYYYRWRILETGTYVWAAGTSNFWTKAASPTSTPTPVSISVQANPTTAALMAPTNFFNANTGLLETALSELFATDADVAAEESRAVGVEQQLGAAVTNLNTRADALETSTGTLNTAVGNLNTSTGSLNSTVGNLVTATQTLNSAVVQLQTDTGTIWTTVGTLNTATNSLNTRVTDLEGGGSAAGWSGFAATQEMYWSYAASVTTNIRVTGSGLDPAVQGDYLYAGAHNGTNYWASTNGAFIYVNASIELDPSLWVWYLYTALEDTPGGDAYFYRSDDPPIGDYVAGPEASGTPTAAYFLTTNTYEWKAGPDPDDGQAWKLTLGGTNIYRAYAGSNVFDKTIYGNGGGLTGVNATNAVTLAGLLASDYAKQANYAATSNLVDLTKSIADGLNSVSSMVNRVTTADYPATSNLVDAVKALADGLNSESNNWHVAYTSVFHGAGSTGRVTSEAGDATKFLKGDGTWSDTPAAAYGTTDSTAARGDWFAAVSGRVDNLITATQTLNTATNSLQSQININMPVGVILAYGASNAPTGWLLCDGAAVSRSTYAALFGVVGTTYGAGDASTTFNVPNLVERFPLGHTNLLGVASGVSSVTLTIDQIPAHTHNLFVFPGENISYPTRPKGNGDDPTLGTRDTSSTGGGLPHTNMPPNLTVNYIIKH
jgi:microcystin-dependent protein/outer membrane murein-binding lipoprotein Lpp